MLIKSRAITMWWIIGGIVTFLGIVSYIIWAVVDWERKGGL